MPARSDIRNQLAYLEVELGKVRDFIIYLRSPQAAKDKNLKRYMRGTADDIRENLTIERDLFIRFFERLKYDASFVDGEGRDTSEFGMAKVTIKKSLRKFGTYLSSSPILIEEGIMALAEVALTDAVHWTRGGRTVGVPELRQILASRLDEAITLDEATRQSLSANLPADAALKKLLDFTAQSTEKEDFQSYIDALVNYFDGQGIEKVVAEALLKNKDKKVGELLEVDTGLTPAKVKELLMAPPSSSATDDFTKGGIDLNPVNLDLQIKRDGNGVPLPLEFQDIPNINVNGFIPVIINITPVTNLPLLLSFNAHPEEPQQLSGVQ